MGVVGTVGAGKSSLVSALLGEMQVCAGKVNLKVSVWHGNVMIVQLRIMVI